MGPEFAPRRTRLPSERQLEILELVRSRPVLRADELATRFGVSVETIRRDFIALEREGRTRRVYGGVTRSTAPTEASYEERRASHEPQKLAMARLAATLIEHDDMLIFDIGTSVAHVASALPRDHRGLVLTNSILAATVLAGKPGLKVLISGGYVRGGDLACSGATAEAFFADFYGGKAFLGSGGVHPVLGLTDFHPDEIPARRIIIEQADACYVMADASKLGKVAPARVCDLAPLTGVITDDGVDDATARDLEAAGVRLLVASVARADAA